MGFFGAAIVILYLKQIQKLYESRDSLHFFRQSANFAILGNTDLGSIQIDSNFSNFSRVIKDCFNKHARNFDGISKNSYPGPS